MFFISADSKMFGPGNAQPSFQQLLGAENLSGTAQMSDGLAGRRLHHAATWVFSCHSDRRATLRLAWRLAWLGVRRDAEDQSEIADKRFHEHRSDGACTCALQPQTVRRTICMRDLRFFCVERMVESQNVPMRAEGLR